MLIRPRAATVKINARDYEAVGDGVADDTAALASVRAAMVAAHAMGLPFTLYLPDGVYRTTTGLRLQSLSDFTIEGLGTISSSAGTTHALQLESCRDFTLNAISAKHSAAGAREVAADAVNLLNCSRGRVIDVRTDYARSIGIRIQGSKVITVRGGEVLNSLADGIGVYSGLRQSGTTGAISAGSQTLTVGDATFLPLSVDDIGSVVIVPGADAAGATLVSTITAVASPTVCTIADAASTTVSAKTIIVGRGCEDVTVTGGSYVESSGDDAYSCVAYNNAGGVAWPVQNKNINFANSTSKDSGARGVAIVGVDGCSVDNMTADSPWRAGIEVAYDAAAASTGSRDVTIRGGRINGADREGGGTSAIQVYSSSTSDPVDNVTVQGTKIRDAHSAHVLVGAASAGTSNVEIDGVRAVGTPASGYGLQVQNTVGAVVRRSRISGAWLASMIVEATGAVRVQDNDMDRANLGAAGFPGYIVTAPTPLITGNRHADAGLGLALDATGSTEPTVYGNEYASGAEALPAGSHVFTVVTT